MARLTLKAAAVALTLGAALAVTALPSFADEQPMVGPFDVIVPGTSTTPTAPALPTGDQGTWLPAGDR